MPPPPGNNPPPPFGGQPFGQQPPAGYQPYGGGGMQPVAPQGTNGLSIAGFVLSLVNVIPCFWFLPLPALLGLIFGMVSRGQIKHSGAKGKGLAIAAVVIGIVFIAIAAIFWVWVATSDNCYRDGSSFHCYSD